MEVKVAKRKKKKLKIIPLGGLGEIGKNITVFEYEDDIIVVDCGMAFPDDEMLGIDLVLPDISYLSSNQNKVRGIVVTHGHEDHIGAIPYVLKEINTPVYGTRLSIGLLENKLEEHKILDISKLNNVSIGSIIELGCFKVEFIRSNHSIPDAVALAIHTPIGVVVHTSDFKIDYTPSVGDVIDLSRFAELGKKGVKLLLSDSTNAERKGFTLSEQVVGKAFEEIFKGEKNRILVATFASNVNRIQQVVNAARKFNRKIAVCGRSMVNVCRKAMELGYLVVPEGMLVDIDKINSVPLEELIIITTGSQGEPMSALARMATGDHRNIEIVAGDVVVISATPIPGNEKTVSKVINALFKKGANVIYSSLADIHVSGHACQEELKLIYSLIKPQFFMPVHGEYRQLRHHGNLVQSMGMPKENIFVMEIGNVLEISSDGAKISGTVPSGHILVDGLGVGDVGNTVLKDRRLLSEDGLIIVVLAITKETGKLISQPDIISRGFIYMKESEGLIFEIKQIVKNALENAEGKNWTIKKKLVKDTLKDYLYIKTKRKPVILPVIVEY